MKEMDRLTLLLAKYFWLRGKPIRNGRFLLQYSNGNVRCEFWYIDTPESNKSDVSYWKRLNAPISSPKECLSYHANTLLREGKEVPWFREYR